MAKLSTLTDDFNDNSTNGALWTDDVGGGSSSDIAESAGRTIIRPTTHFPARFSALNYDFSNSQIIVQVPVVPATGTTGTLQAALAVALDGTNHFKIGKLGANLVAYKTIGGTSTPLYSAAYSSTSHLWWRIRETSGVIYWEVAADGVHFAQIFSITTPFTVTSMYVELSAGWTTSTEASPGTLEIETVNPILLSDLAGNPAASYTNQAVTNATSSAQSFTANGASSSTGSATINQGIRDLAGNLAVGYTDQPVTNSTPASSISASGASTSSGSATLNKIIVFTATGSGGGGPAYDSSILYDAPVLYDAQPSVGSVDVTIFPAGSGPITASGSSVSVGSALFAIVPVGGFAASGLSTSSGSATLTIPIVNITGTGITVSTGSAQIVLNNTISAAGTSFSTGTASISRVMRVWLFEPPIVYDNPTTLPPPFPQVRNSYARWQKGQPRGRTVLKSAGVYILCDSPTVDQLNAADIAYQGGHIYTVSDDEAHSLQLAGYAVTPSASPLIVGET